MSVIACGNKLTAHAAKEMLDKGGNAFDAITAASFTSCVAEPMLTSLAGGGIGLIRTSSGRTRCIDFLTNFPKSDSHVKPIKKVVNFGDDTQVFYLGYGSLGVPGSLEGFLHIYKRYCTLGLDAILAPSIRYAKGHRLDKLQARVLRILETFCVYTAESREVFKPKGRLLRHGEVIRNRKFADFLEALAKDEDSAIDIYQEAVERTLKGRRSTLSPSDIYSYKVHEKAPVSIRYHGHGIDLASPPSAGGILVAHALKYIERKNVGRLGHNSYEHVRILADAMKECDARRTKRFFKSLLYEKGFWKSFLKKDRLGSTTHISIIDDEGNAASVTTSNGQGAGIMIKGTGIMLNNFAAEPDLMQYRELYRPGERITSMMSPAMISREGKLSATLGTGGSNRIRSAILQTVSNLIDFGMAPQEATDASRVHFEDGLLQVEPGIETKELRERYKTNIWTEKSLFFGGVHIAGRESGGGDMRRGGAVITC